MIIEIVQYTTVVNVAPQGGNAVDIVPENRPEIVNIEIVNNGSNEGIQNLQNVTDNGDTTTNDIEITDYSRGLVLTTGLRRARITLTDDGFGDLQLTITEL